MSWKWFCPIPCHEQKQKLRERDCEKPKEVWDAKALAIPDNVLKILRQESQRCNALGYEPDLYDLATALVNAKDLIDLALEEESDTGVFLAHNCPHCGRGNPSFRKKPHGTEIWCDKCNYSLVG